jgi:hypothetical protein
MNEGLNTFKRQPKNVCEAYLNALEINSFRLIRYRGQNIPIRMAKLKFDLDGITAEFIILTEWTTNSPDLNI